MFWVLPAVFVLFNLFQSFQLDGLLYSGRLLCMYTLLSLMLTGLLLLFYLLFYLGGPGAGREYPAEAGKPVSSHADRPI